MHVPQVITTNSSSCKRAPIPGQKDSCEEECALVGVLCLK